MQVKRGSKMQQKAWQKEEAYMSPSMQSRCGIHLCIHMPVGSVKQHSQSACVEASRCLESFPAAIHVCTDRQQMT